MVMFYPCLTLVSPVSPVSDAYDRHQKELEEKLDERTAALIHLQRVALEHDAAGYDIYMSMQNS